MKHFSFYMKRIKHYIARATLVALVIVLSGCVVPATQTRYANVDGELAPSPAGQALPGALTLQDKFRKSNDLYEEGRLVEAEKWFLNIVSSHPDLADPWFKLGNIYYRSGRYAAAVNAFESVLKNDNTYEQAWFNLALTRLSQSVEVLDQGLPQIDPKSPYFQRTIRLRNRLINRPNGVSDEPDRIVTTLTSIEPESSVNPSQAITGNAESVEDQRAETGSAAINANLDDGETDIEVGEPDQGP